MKFLLWIVFGTSSSAIPLPLGTNFRFEKGSVLPRSTSTASASSEDLHPPRDLAWSETTSICNDELYGLLLATDPTIDSCFEGDIQWDADGILTAASVTVFGTEKFWDTTIPSVITTYVATYNGNAFCDKFDSCVLTFEEPIDIVSLPGQYTYDCSNVYCGPNAARSCDGTYSAGACPAGVDEASLPDIPLLRDVSCQKFLFNLQGTALQDTCGSCEKSPDSDTTTVTCDASCLGCDNNGDCATVQEGVVFSELLMQTVSCITFKEDEVCYAISAPAEVGGYGDPILFGCQATLNENMCTCSICGYKDGAALADSGLYSIADLQLEIDCTGVDGVTTFSQCTDASTGFFQSINTAGNACADGQTPPVPMMPPIAPPPIMNVVPQPGEMSPVVGPPVPQATAPEMAPQLPPTFVTPVTAPVNLPVAPATVVSPVASPTSAVPPIPANTPVNPPVAPTLLSPVTIAMPVAPPTQMPVEAAQPTSLLGGAGAVRNASSGGQSALSLLVAGVCFVIAAGI